MQKVDLLGSGHVLADPSATNGDITDVFVHFRYGRLVIRANYVDLQPLKNTMLDVTGEIKTNEGRRWIYDVATTPTDHRGHDQLLHYRNFSRACEIGHLFDYRRSFTRVVVPMSCLGHPSWVKVSVGAATVQFDRQSLKRLLASNGRRVPHGMLVLRTDDAGRSNVVDQLAFTPRVHR